MSFRSVVSVPLACLAASSVRVRAFGSSAALPGILGARQLGGTDLVVSEACLGTMTFGMQNTLEEAFEQIDFARSKGVNFIDTAELYPVPTADPKWKSGTTEGIVGEYLHNIGPSEREKLVIATKIAGYIPESDVAANRYEPPSELKDARLDATSVRDACEASLRRLQTDYIDLYQVHWPDRYVPIFGQMEFKPYKKREDSVPIRETAAALKELMDEGKVRYIGISNETPLGVFQWIQACEELGMLDKLATIQNTYNLVDRRFDNELAEICDEYNIGLLPWSILAGGLLSGKYRSSQPSADPGSRFIKYPTYMRRWSPTSASPQTLKAVDAYAEIAQKAGMTPTELAIFFVRSRHFIVNSGSTIVGATSLDQLKENLSPFETPLENFDLSLIDAINAVHMQCRDPSCFL